MLTLIVLTLIVLIASCARHRYFLARTGLFAGLRRHFALGFQAAGAYVRREGRQEMQTISAGSGTRFGSVRGVGVARAS